MPTQLGSKAFRWALPNFGMTGTGIGTFLPNSVSFRKEATSVEIPDGGGNTIGEIKHNFKELLTANVTISADTTAAIGAANAIPNPGTIVEVADADDDEISTDSTTKYILESASKDRSNSDVAKATFELKRYTDNNVAQAVPTGA